MSAAPTADAKIWQTGRTWAVHARHPFTGAWIRRCGIATQAEAVVEADALCWQLDREARAAVEGSK